MSRLLGYSPSGRSRRVWSVAQHRALEDRLHSLPSRLGNGLDMACADLCGVASVVSVGEAQCVVTMETGDRAEGLSFGLLGPLQVSRDGTPLPLGGRQQRAVLALLMADDGATVSVDRL